MNTLKRNIKSLISTIKSSSRHVTNKVRSLFKLKAKKSMSSKIATSNATTAVSIKEMVPESAASIHSSILMCKLKNKLFEMIENRESGLDTIVKEEEQEEKCEIALTVIKSDNSLNLKTQKQRSGCCYKNEIIKSAMNYMPKEVPTYRIPKKIYFNLSWILSQVLSIQRSHNPMDWVDYRHYLLT